MQQNAIDNFDYLEDEGTCHDWGNTQSPENHHQYINQKIKKGKGVSMSNFAFSPENFSAKKTAVINPEMASKNISKIGMMQDDWNDSSQRDLIPMFEAAQNSNLKT